MAVGDPNLGWFGGLSDRVLPRSISAAKEDSLHLTRSSGEHVAGSASGVRARVTTASPLREMAAELRTSNAAALFVRRLRRQPGGAVSEWRLRFNDRGECEL